MASIRCAHCQQTHTTVVEVARCAEHIRGGHVEYYHERCPQCAIEQEVHLEALAEEQAERFAEDWSERMTHREP